jgi:hypothetical protein
MKMNRKLGLLFVLIFSTFLVAAKITTSTLLIGKGTAENIDIVFDEGSVNKPAIRWDDSSSQITFSADGVTYNSILVTASPSNGADANTVLTNASPKVQLVVPTASRDYTLPTTGVEFGGTWEIYNDRVHSGTSVFSIVVKSSDGDTVATLMPGMRGKFVALQNTPTDTLHWDQGYHLVSEWLTFTPVGSWTNTTYTGSFRRNGDSLDLDIHWVLTNTPGAANLTYTLPLSLAIDSTKLAGPETDSSWLGGGTFTDSGTANYSVFIKPTNTTTLGVRLFNVSGTYATDATLSNTLPVAASTADDGHIRIIGIPISTWTATKG